MSEEVEFEFLAPPFGRMTRFIQEQTGSPEEVHAELQEQEVLRPRRPATVQGRPSA